MTVAPRKTKSDVRAPGEAMKADDVRHCLTCRFRLAGCKDPKRLGGLRYRCSKWKELPILDFDMDMEAVLKLGREQSAERDAKPRANHGGSGSRTMDDAVRLVEDSLDSELPVPPDFKLDDRDFSAAKNFFEWLNHKDFAKQGQAVRMPFWGKQLEILTNFTGEWCPRCSRDDYLTDVPLAATNAEFLDNVTLLEHGVCPKCKASKSEMVLNGELIDPTMIVGVAGQRGGKTSTITAMESYYIHRWVKLPDPQAMFGVLPQQVLTGTYAALSFAQAKKNIWIPLTNIIRESPWFSGFHNMLTDYAIRTGEKELFNFGEEMLLYRHRRLFFALASANKRTLRGDTRIAAIVDELGLWRFDKDSEDKERASGPEIYASLENQMLTIEVAYERNIKKGYSDLPKPHMCAISSPMDINDTIMAKYREAEGDRRFTRFMYPTWGINPDLPFESSFLQSRLKANPDKFWRDYGAVPPLSSSGWITEIDNVAPLFAKKRRNAAIVTQRVVRNKFGALRTTGSLRAATLAGGRLLSLDAGHSGNSFAFCVAHLQTDDDGSNDIGKVVIDAVGELVPRAKAPISFNSVWENIIKPLIGEHNIQVVLADHWQSKLLLSKMEEQGIYQKEVRLKYDHFSAARSDFYDKRLSFPKLEMDSLEDILTVKRDDSYPERFIGKPVSHLLFQIMSVRDIVGKEVAKGSGSTDDIFRCVILAHWGLRNAEIAAMLKTVEEEFDSGLFGLVKGGTMGAAMQNHLGSSLSLPKLGDSTNSSGGVRSFSRSGDSGGAPAVFGVTKGGSR